MRRLKLYLYHPAILRVVEALTLFGHGPGDGHHHFGAF